MFMRWGVLYLALKLRSAYGIMAYIERNGQAKACPTYANRVRHFVAGGGGWRLRPRAVCAGRLVGLAESGGSAHLC